jgi:hypothetical protein
LTYHQLTREERYFICTRLRSGASMGTVAREMVRSASTISREVSRKASRRDGAYRPSRAQQYARARRSRCRRWTLFKPDDWAYFHALLRKKWSPGRIAGALRMGAELSISTARSTATSCVIASSEARCGSTRGSSRSSRASVNGASITGAFCLASATSASAPRTWSPGAHRALGGRHGLPRLRERAELIAQMAD